MPSSAITRTSVPGSAKNTLNRLLHSFNVGDKVQVAQEVTRLKELQEGHGGWNPRSRMAEFIGKVGTVHRVTDKGDIRVQYESGIRWTFNPAAVTKITSFSVGDIVQVLSDIAKVKELQKGHGEWVDVMKNIVGKTGTIIKIYADYDLRLNFGTSLWTMNPLAVSLIRCDRFESNNWMYANANRQEESMSQNPMKAMLLRLLDYMTVDTSFTVEQFVRKAGEGRIETIKKMLPKMKDRINDKNEFGQTALQVAAYQGHLDIVVLLITHGANLEISDNDLDTPLHNSSTGFWNTGLLIAIVMDNRDIIDCLINTLGTDFSILCKDGLNSCHRAAIEGDQYAIKRILGKARHLIDVKDAEDGFTALHFAAENGHYDVVKTLLKKGQDQIDIQTYKKATPLMVGVLQGYWGVTEYFVEKGASLTIENVYGDTVMDLIMFYHIDGNGGQPLSRVTSVELKKHENAPNITAIWNNLITCGWDSNDVDLAGAALACFMAKAGADLNRRNKAGVTPFDLARTDRLKKMLVYYSTERQRTFRLENAIGFGVEAKSTGARQSMTILDQHMQSSASRTPGGEFPSSPLELLGSPLLGECLICSDIVQFVTFEPCGHRIVCKECCYRMKKCLTCQETISQKIRGGRIISGSGATTSRSKKLNTEILRYLENKFTEMEETYCCSTCMERRKNVSLPCGLGGGERCANAFSTCELSNSSKN